MKDDFLHKYKSENPYRVPQGYFDQKHQELLAIARRNSSKKSGKLKSLFWSLSGVAAAFLIGFAVWTLTQSPGSQTTELSFSQEEISEYMITELSYLNEDLLYEELTSSELEEEFGTTLENENIEAYLDENYDQTLHYEYL